MVKSGVSNTSASQFIWKISRATGKCRDSLRQICSSLRREGICILVDLKSAQHTCYLPRGIRIVGLASALSSRIVVAPARETTISAAPHDCAISSLLTNGTTVSYHFHNLQLRLSL